MARGGGEQTLSLNDGVCALLKDAFEDAPFEFWARDLTGRCIVANAATRALGVDDGNHIEDAQVPPDVVAAWHENNRRAYAGEVVQNEFEYGSGDSKRYLECYIVPLRINNEIQGVLGFNIDVTRHRRTEQALRDSERRLREALRVGRMGWFDWDIVANEIRWSPETYRLFGHEPGSSFVPSVAVTRSMLVDDEVEFVLGHLEAMMKANAPYDITHRMVRKDGDVIHVHALGEVERDDAGCAVRMLGTLVDITERKKVEEELREVDRQRSEFLGVLSHELRTPLAVIASAAHCLDRNSLLDEHARAAVDAIQRQARHVSRLVDDLLDITRVRSGKINLQRTSVDLVELARRTIDDHRHLLGSHVVTTNLPPGPVWTQGDPTRLAQIVSNLLSNALKFTPSGGAISMSLTVEDGRAMLAVVDTGVGIDSDALRGLFVPFVQADRSLDRSRQGLGLGLALAKTLVELHGGEIRATSAGPGQGSTFTVTLPLVECEPAQPRLVTRVAATPRNVLIIEDDVDAAEWLSHVVSFFGHRVTITHDGNSGLRKAREVMPDVILCDLGLPGGLDGYAVAQSLQCDALFENTYRIALSGYTQPEDQAKARAAGFDAHVSKPPDLDALASLLATLPKSPR